MGLTVLKSRHWLCYFLEALEYMLFPCLFQLPGVAHIPWIMVPSFIFKAGNIASL